MEHDDVVNESLLALAERLRSPLPTAQLTGWFVRPFDNAVATARTCYSAKGIVTPEQVAGDHLTDPAKREAAKARRDALARSIYEAGHHTTLQHAHFQFALTNVSRNLIWSVLHAHPFYNSEQVSQRYVPVQPDQVLRPALPPEAASIYDACVAQQMASYANLCEVLEPLARAHYLRRFPGRAAERHAKQVQQDVRKRCMEVARYVLPIATFAYLYHTVSGLTLLRYYRLAQIFDVPTESRLVLEAMMRAVLDLDPGYKTVVADPLPLEATPEYQAFAQWLDRLAATQHARSDRARAYAADFDAKLDGGVSKLVAATPGGEEVLAQAVRDVLGAPPGELDDQQAIRWVLDSSRNHLLGDALNLSLHSKLMRAGQHVHYTFRKKLSHTADSQDQRHRMTPGSRPILFAHVMDQPDTVDPLLIREAEADGTPAGAAIGLGYRESLARSYEAVARLVALGVEPEMAAYLLPNAHAVRFMETGD